MLHKSLQHLLEIKHLGLAINQRNTVNTKHALQLGLCVEVVKHNLAGVTTAYLNHHAHAVFVGLIAQFSDAFDFLLFHQLCNALD